MSQSPADDDPWLNPSSAGGERFARFIANLRVLLDHVAAANPPEHLWGHAADRINELSGAFVPFAVPESEQVTGHRHDLPGRGQVMSPAVAVDEADDDHLRARVHFGRHYLGGNGAVHGGAIPLVFDEVLGRLANAGGRARSRTAYLHVNYRAVVPIEEELRLTGRLDREDGRKRFLVGELRHGEQLVADAEGLFVALRPGQP